MEKESDIDDIINYRSVAERELEVRFLCSVFAQSNHLQVLPYLFAIVLTCKDTANIPSYIVTA